VTFFHYHTDFLYSVILLPRPDRAMPSSGSVSPLHGINAPYSGKIREKFGVVRLSSRRLARQLPETVIVE
jgi:hypothetical protein